MLQADSSRLTRKTTKSRNAGTIGHNDAECNSDLVAMVERTGPFFLLTRGLAKLQYERIKVPLCCCVVLFTTLTTEAMKECNDESRKWRSRTQI